MLTTVSCAAPYGVGGLGRHLAQTVEELRAAGELGRYYCSSPAAGDELGVRVDPAVGRYAARYTPVRFSPGQRANLGAALFDRAVAARLVPAERHIGFSGQALRTFQACPEVVRELISPTAHVDHVWRQHERAWNAHPIERPWLNEAQRRRSRREYELAETIWVTSAYAYGSFVENGVNERKLRLQELRPDPRFRPPARARRDDGIFRVVYVGALSVVKGIPVLLDAFGRIDDPQAELTLVGGWGTRAMRRYLEVAVTRDPRVRVSPGDPLPHLVSADVYVHPSYHDGLGLAPLEARACGVPVIVTEDTGMRDLVDGANGWVVPTGNVDAIAELMTDLNKSRLAGSPC